MAWALTNFFYSPVINVTLGHVVAFNRIELEVRVGCGMLKCLCTARNAATLLPLNSVCKVMAPHMTATQIQLCERLKQLGFSRQNQIRLYGTQFDLVGDPLVISNDVVFVDAVERKSGESCRVRIPLNIVRMATEQASQTYAA